MRNSGWVVRLMRSLALLTVVAGGAVVVADGDAAAATQCVNADSDSDGDGWGWENNQSCKMPTETTETTEVGDPGNGRPICLTDSDPDGDGFGWENEKTCVVQDPPADNGDGYSEAIDMDPETTPDADQPGAALNLPAAFSQSCATVESFLAGCNTSAGAWTPAFAQYANTTGAIAAGTDVGARVQILSVPGEQGAQQATGGFASVGNAPANQCGAAATERAASTISTAKVLYIIGPYLPPENGGGFANVCQEVGAVWQVAPAVAGAAAEADAAGATVVYVGFGHIHDAQIPVSSRVAATKEAIRSFEGVRRYCCEPNDSMLIGVSLGGVVGKMALREFDGEFFEHGVDTYLSFDSPHGGAWIPYSLQFAPIFLKGGFRWMDRYNLGSQESEINAAIASADQVINETLKNPVAQDLLLTNLAYPDDRSPNIDYVLGRYWDLPLRTYNVAVASGAIDGTGPVRTQNFLTVRSGDGGRYDARLNMDLTPPTAGLTTRVFDGELSYQSPISFNFIIPEFGARIGYPGTFTQSPGGIPIDNGPCGFSSTTINRFADELRGQLASALWTNPSVVVNDDRVCFIPTYSAVISFGDGSGLPIVGSSAFDDVIGDSTNHDHMQVSPQMAVEIRDVVDRTYATGIAARSSKRGSSAPGPGADRGSASLPDSSSLGYVDGAALDSAEADRLGVDGPNGN